MASSKELRPLIREAQRQGWTVELTRRGRYRWTNPAGGTPYFSASTPSDRRAVHNIVSDLHRRGLATAR